jgi:hypothetical protein
MVSSLIASIFLIIALTRHDPYGYALLQESILAHLSQLSATFSGFESSGAVEAFGSLRRVRNELE